MGRFCFLKKVFEYAGEYRKYTCCAMLFMFLGLIMSIVPFYLIFQIIRPLLVGESLSLKSAMLFAAGIGLCLVLHAVCYNHGLTLPHISVFNILKNLRISLQGKLERQPLGAIQDKGTVH